MNAYCTYVTVEDPNRIVLSDIPFVAGQRVEILVVEVDNTRSEYLDELRILLRTTQALPGAHTISQDEIAAEIEAYRQGR